MKILKNIQFIFILIALLLNIGNLNAKQATKQIEKAKVAVKEVKSEKIAVEKEKKEEENEDSAKSIEAQNKQQDINETIDNASLDAKKNAQDAQKSLIEANKIASESDSKYLVQLAKNKAAIEKSRKEIAKLQLSLANDLKKTNKELDKIANSLKKIEETYSDRHLSKQDLKKNYNEVVFYWRILADNSLRVFSKKSNIKIEKYHPGDLFHKIPKEVTDQALIKQRNDSYESLKTEYSNIFNLKRDLKIANKNYQSDLLLKSSELRASILQKILYMDEGFVTYDNEYVEDLIRELKLIPYQPIFVFYSKIQQYKQTIDSGFTGFLNILKQAGLLVILILIVMVSKRTLTKLTYLFNLLSQFLVKKSISDSQYTGPAILVSKITPYFKWFVLSLIFFLINTVIERTLFSELGVLIPYFQYYFLYKIFRIFAHYSLTNIVHKNIESNAKERSIINEKIRKTTKVLGFYLLWSVYIVHLTQAIVNKGYFYNLTFNIFVIGLIIILAIIASNWKGELKIIVKSKLSKRLARAINKLLSGKKIAVLMSLPILLLLIIREFFYKIFNLLRNYDFFKNMLSQIYRKKLESAAKMADKDGDDDSAISDSYLKAFSKASKDDVFIPIKDHPSEEFKEIIDSWQSGRSEENSIAIHSEKGIGKGKFIEKIISDNDDNFEVLQAQFSRKITDKNELLKVISDLFGKGAGEKALFNFLSKYNKKTIIILDDCHNLFLAKEGGFEALKLLLDMLVKIDNPNLLWVATFNSYSWNYLRHSLKINNYFRYILRLPRWSDENIRQLIIDKHNKTGFKLIYDPLIFAISTNKSEKEFEDLQQKFFQIIWSQSRGNPTIAISLWLSSLKTEGAKSVKVSLPKIAKSSQLNSLADEHLFAYSAIVKHQSLSIEDISVILSISPEEVLNIIRIGLEKGYLVSSLHINKSFTTSPQWQTAINQLLINRNFVYAE